MPLASVSDTRRGLALVPRSGAVGERALGVAGTSLKVVAILFMLAPALTIVVLSFGEENLLVFPPQSWGPGLYSAFFGSDYWLGAVWTSIKIAVPSGALALAVGGLAAWALSRMRVPFPNLTLVAGITPLVIPSIAYAIAMYTLFTKYSLVYTALGLILADAVLAIPFVLLVGKAALDRIPQELELVAMSLGASRRRAVATVTVPLWLPALTTSFLLAFMVSFDESTFVQFLGGTDQITLPKAIFDSARTGTQPLIQAIATVLMVSSAVVYVATTQLRRSAARVRVGAEPAS